MSQRIYLCGDCCGPIWFPYGEKMHIGTGWDCWRRQHEGGGGAAGDDAPCAAFHFVFGTDPALLDELVKNAIRLYKHWVRDPAEPSPVDFLREQLRRGRSDVIHNFLLFLAPQKEKTVGQLIRRLMSTAEWERLVHPRKRRHAPNPRRAAPSHHHRRHKVRSPHRA
jgi:hypothetical protein